MIYLRTILKRLTDIRVIYASVGIVLSVVAHELFHIMMHFGNITNIEFFPDFFSVVTITSNVPAGYDFVAEEFVAYTITLIILLITCVDVAAIHDSRRE